MWIDKVLAYEFITPNVHRKAELRIKKLQRDLDKYKRIVNKPIKDVQCIQD